MREQYFDRAHGQQRRDVATGSGRLWSASNHGCHSHSRSEWPRERDGDGWRFGSGSGFGWSQR